MQPFLPKMAYHHVVRRANLAGPINRANPVHAPISNITAAWSRDSYTRKDCFKQAVAVHALYGAGALFVPASIGIGVASACIGGPARFAAWWALGAVGEGTAPSTEWLDILHGMSATPAGKTDAAWRAKLSNDYQFGALGAPERIARDRARKAFDDRRGFAHAAWTGLAVGCNALLWLPRVGAALMHQVASMTGALVGACVGVVRFCIDAFTHDYVRAPRDYIWGAPPSAYTVSEARRALESFDFRRDWLKPVFDPAQNDGLARAEQHLARLNETDLGLKIERLAKAVASQRSLDPGAHATLRRVTVALLGDACTPKTLPAIYRRRSRAVHPDKGPERRIRGELAKALTALKESIDGLPTLKNTFFPSPA